MKVAGDKWSKSPSREFMWTSWRKFPPTLIICRVTETKMFNSFDVKETFKNEAAVKTAFKKISHF